MAIQTLTVVKIGGNIVDSASALNDFIKKFSALPSPKILIHGGGKLATRLSEQMGIETTMIDGRRVTDAATLRVVVMVYAGEVNKTITAKLQGEGVNAWGITGADGACIRAVKRVGAEHDYGFVGDIPAQGVNKEALLMLLNNCYTPVIAPISMTSEGQLLNTNADTIAQSVAVAMSEHYDTVLVYMFEKSGVLLDLNDEASCINTITPSYYAELKAQKVIAAGMIPKLDNAFVAINQGVSSVRICKTLENESGTKIKLY